MSLQSDRQQKALSDQDSDSQSFQCTETLEQAIFTPNHGRLKQCGCRCRCNYEIMMEDPLQKKRQKRKESKRRQKQKQKQQKEKAMLSIEKVIRDIYAHHTNFRKIQGQVERCLAISNNRDRICEFINTIIRDQVELVRKQLRILNSKYQQLQLGSEHNAVLQIFAPIRRVAEASEEIQKLINFFVNKFSDEEEEPTLQKNFARTTLNYIKRNDLQYSNVFRKIRNYIFSSSPEMYPFERQLVNMMTPPCQLLLQDSFDTEEGTEDYYDQEDEWEEELSTIESQKCTLEHEHEQEHEHECGDKKNKKKKQRRRKRREDIETGFEAICRRTEQMEWSDQERTQCHVTQQFLARMRKRKWKYLARQE